MAVEMKDEGYIPAWRPWWREAAATRCRRRELRRRVSSCYDEKKKLAVFWGVTLPSSSFMEIFQIFLSSRRMLRNLTQQFKMKKKIKKKKWRGRQTPTKNNWRKDDEVNFNCPIGVKRASSLQTLKFKKKILIRFKKLKSNQQRQTKNSDKENEFVMGQETFNSLMRRHVFRGWLTPRQQTRGYSKWRHQ